MPKEIDSRVVFVSILGRICSFQIIPTKRKELWTAQVKTTTFKTFSKIIIFFLDTSKFTDKTEGVFFRNTFFGKITCFKVKHKITTFVAKLTKLFFNVFESNKGNKKIILASCLNTHNKDVYGTIVYPILFKVKNEGFPQNLNFFIPLSIFIFLGC